MAEDLKAPCLPACKRELLPPKPLFAMSNKAPNPSGVKPNHLQSAKDRIAAGQPAFCLHQTWGIGVIRGYDDATKRFTLDFPEQNKAGHIMDESLFKGGKIEILNPESLLASAYADATKEKVAKLVASDPAELVKTILAEFTTGECTSYALEAILDRIHFASLPASATKERQKHFKSWWTKARAALRKDRAILIPEQKGGIYALLEAPKDLGEDLFGQYEVAPNFERKLAILAELADSSTAETRSAATEANLAKVSADLAKAITSLSGSRRQSQLPVILSGIWNRDKFFRPTFENVETISPTASDIIALCDEQDLAFLALNIQHTTEKIRSLLDLIRAHHGNNWSQRTFELLRNRDIGGTKSGSAKLVSETIAYLCDQELGALVAERFAQWLESRELRAPLIIWIIKTRDSKKYAEIVQRLISPSLLSAIFSSIDAEALESNSSARIPLANELVKDRKLISDILAPKDGAKVDSETIFDLSRMMLRSQGFDEMTKSKLLTRISEIERKVLTLANKSKGNETTGQETYSLSPAKKDEFMNELENITKVQLPETKEAINRAKEMGDLKENSEYKMARQEHDRLVSRVLELDKYLKKSNLADYSKATTEQIGIGSSVKLLRHSDKSEISYDILGAFEGKEVGPNVIAYNTPLAQQFLTHKKGETFTTSIRERSETWTVLSIERWVDKK
jgi:transcription elongation GreA/GreB family factor